MTAMAETSLDAFRSLSPKDDLQRLELRIMELFEAPEKLSRGRPWPPMPPVALTRHEIARITGLELSSVCGRCNSLVTKGCLEERGEVKGESGRARKLLRLPEKQRSLF